MIIGLRDTTRSRSIAAASAALACWIGTAISGQPTEERVAFTVRDSIEFERVVRQSDDLYAFVQANPIGATALAAPNNAHFIFQTRKGLVEQNVLQDTLWIVDGGELWEFLENSSHNSHVLLSTLLSRQTTSERGTVSNVRWLSAGEVGYIAADDRGVRQAFVVDIARRHSRQLTSSPTDVTSFAAKGSTVLYYAAVEDKLPQAYSIRSTQLDVGSIIDPKTYSELFPRVELFVQVGHEPAKIVASPPIRLLPPFQSISISPDERFAIAMQPAMGWPGHWEEYQLPRMEASQYSRTRATADGTSLALLNRIQYRLIDVRSRTSSPLIDAPTGTLSRNFTPARAFWLSDSGHVVVSGTFLPLDQTEGPSRERRARHPAIAEIEIPSRKVTPIVWEPFATWDSGSGREIVENPIVALDFIRDQLIVHMAAHRGSVLASFDRDAMRTSRYAKVSGTWKQVPAGRDSNRLEGLSLDVRQDLNVRPKLYATGDQCQCTKVLWDLNPGADRFTFGRATVIEWKDRNDITWQGGLVTPPAYDERRRYPLVIQTHGFHSKEFLIDGPQGTTTAFAAQPLANAGFIVIQIEENVRAETGDAHEASLYAEGMRSVIEKLDSEGIIDPTRVAAIGWSITGSYVMRLMADNPGILAAAVISDAAQFGYMPYLLRVNLPSSMRTSFERFVGVELGRAKPEDLISRDPTHRIAPRAPPIRLEAIRPGSALGMWETYALLRFADRPVDFVYFPYGSHSLQKPGERMASQQGTVSWLRFWLQGFEDNNSTSMQQYELWRSMRTSSMVRR